ncbi:hypothetical protein KM043_018852 [Ampulex compressa]|nr:hypothetical protein KM043_018852 [Ampulex compressa]
MARMNRNLEDVQRKQSSLENVLRDTPSTIPFASPRHAEEELPNRASGELRVHDVLQQIPPFDGYNIPITEYVRACKRARDILHPSAERELTKTLISQLQGRAYFVAEDERCENITQYTDLLVSAFGQTKSVDYYRGELSMIQMHPNEHMLDFISRVKILRSSIRDAERKEKGVLLESTEDEIDALAKRQQDIHGASAADSRGITHHRRREI